MLVPSLHWIIIEDAKTKTDLVSNLLQKSGLSYTHLNAETPTEWRLAPGEQRWTKPRGVVQRNAGLDWIRSKVDRSSEGTIFFGDDDNTYALEIFEEVRLAVE
jgi:galactosylgalactosylxylosylprotein 3-beta-glucuronosyltransferase 3